MQVQGIPLPGEAEQRALGRAVRELRARRSLSQEELARRSRLHRNYVGAMERGQINPTLRTMLRLSAGLALPLSEMVVVYERQLGYERQRADAGR